MDPLTERALAEGACADPTTAYTTGNSMLRITERMILEWEACSDRTDSGKPDCMALSEQQVWLDKRRIVAYLVISNNFADYASFEEPIKLSAIATTLDFVDSKNTLVVTVPISMHDATF